MIMKIQIKMSSSHKFVYCLILLINLKLFTCDEQCLIGWRLFEGSCYFLSSEKLNWILAEGSCRSHNGRLAEVTIKSHDDFLRGAVSGYSDNFWLGARDDVLEGTWQWAFTNEVFNYTHWAPGQPNDYHNQDCLGYDHDDNHLWNDLHCGDRYKYICETRPQTDGLPILG